MWVSVDPLCCVSAGGTSAKVPPTEVPSAELVLPQYHHQHNHHSFYFSKIRKFLHEFSAHLCTFSPVSQEIECGKIRNMNWIKLREVYCGYFVFRYIFCKMYRFSWFVNVLAQITIKLAIHLSFLESWHVRALFRELFREIANQSLCTSHNISDFIHLWLLSLSPLWRFVKIPTVWRERRNARWEKWLARWFTKCQLYTYRFSHFTNIFSRSRQFDDKCIAGLNV